MTVKANCHQVDCDKATGDGGTWAVPASESTSASYHTVLMKDSSNLLVLYGDSRTGLHLDADGVARDLGSGNKVGLPCTAHPFTSGDTIRIGGTTYYDLAPPTTVEAETTANEIVIVRPAGFIAETFDGTESVVTYLSNIFEGNVTDGFPAVYGDYMYVPLNNGVDATCICRVNLADYTVDLDFFDAPTPAYGATEKCTAVAITDDGQFLYMNMVNYFISRPRVLKYNVSTGAFVWSYVPSGGSDAYQCAVDSNDMCYTANHRNTGTGLNEACRIKADGSSVDQWYKVDSPNGHNCVILDEDNDQVFFFGSKTQSGSTVYDHMMFRFDLDTYAAEIRTSITGTVNADKVYIAQMYNDEIFLLQRTFTYNGESKNIFVLNKDLEVQHSLYSQYAATIWFANGYLYVAKNSSSYVGDDTIDYYDPTDLSYLGSIYAGSVQGNVNPLIDKDGFVTYGTYSLASYNWSDQYRTTAYPQDYAHIEGQTVQVLEDGIYIGDYVVTGGEVTI